MQGIAEGDQPDSASSDDVLRVPEGVTTGDLYTDTRKDLLAVVHCAHARRQGGDDLLGRTSRLQQFALGPFRLGDQVVGIGERRLVTAWNWMPGPTEMIDVQVGEGHHLDLLWPAADLG